MIYGKIIDLKSWLSIINHPLLSTPIYGNPHMGNLQVIDWGLGHLAKHGGVAWRLSAVLGGFRVAVHCPKQPNQLSIVGVIIYIIYIYMYYIYIYVIYIYIICITYTLTYHFKWLVELRRVPGVWPCGLGLGGATNTAVNRILRALQQHKGPARRIPDLACHMSSEGFQSIVSVK